MDKRLSPSALQKREDEKIDKTLAPWALRERQDEETDKGLAPSAHGKIEEKIDKISPVRRWERPKTRKRITDPRVWSTERHKTKTRITDWRLRARKERRNRQHNSAFATGKKDKETDNGLAPSVEFADNAASIVATTSKY